MPFKTDVLALNDPFLDRRTRLLPCQRERLLALRQTGLSYRALGQLFNVSKRSAYFCCNPDKDLIAKAQAVERRRDGRYYEKNAHKLAMRQHRRHKHTALSHD